MAYSFANIAFAVHHRRIEAVEEDTICCPIGYIILKDGQPRSPPNSSAVIKEIRRVNAWVALLNMRDPVDVKNGRLERIGIAQINACLYINATLQLDHTIAMLVATIMLESHAVGSKNMAITVCILRCTQKDMQKFERTQCLRLYKHYSSVSTSVQDST